MFPLVRCDPIKSIDIRRRTKKQNVASDVSIHAPAWGATKNFFVAVALVSIYDDFVSGLKVDDFEV